MAYTVLVVAAHPDDEVLGCGGTMARHAAEGDEVHVIFMADGVTSRDTGHGENQKRRNEAADKSCRLLGVKAVHYLNFPDNRMDSLPLLDIVRPLETLISNIHPNIVYTHHIGDLNVDHRITHQAVMTACRPIPGQTVVQIFSFEVLSSTEWQTPFLLPFSPNRFVNISKYLDLKRSALQAYAEELRPQPHSRSAENVMQLAHYRGNCVGHIAAEAFIVVREIY